MTSPPKVLFTLSAVCAVAAFATSVVPVVPDGPSVVARTYLDLLLQPPVDDYIRNVLVPRYNGFLAVVVILGIAAVCLLASGLIVRHRSQYAVPAAMAYADLRPTVPVYSQAPAGHAPKAPPVTAAPAASVNVVEYVPSTRIGIAGFWISIACAVLLSGWIWVGTVFSVSAVVLCLIAICIGPSRFRGLKRAIWGLTLGFVYTAQNLILSVVYVTTGTLVGPAWTLF